MTSDSKSSQPRGPQTPSTPRRQRAGVPITPGSASRDRSIDAGRPPSTLGNRSPSPIKVRAPLSVEAKQRKKVTSFSGVHNSSAKIRSAANSPVPSTPPRNPNFERPKSSHAKPFPSLVRQIFSQAEDPEESLVDWRSVPPDDGDVSIEVDDDSNFFAPDAGSQDKVLVSVRIKPSAEGEESAWFSEQLGVVKLRDIHARPGATNPEYRYDNVLTGSFNKEIYNAAAKSHVRAAMEGFNAVIFAYGQTASGKTFTL
ncbi:Kinesin-like protein kip2, partial [Tulasnella sp. 419]